MDRTNWALAGLRQWWRNWRQYWWLWVSFWAAMFLLGYLSR